MLVQILHYGPCYRYAVVGGCAASQLVEAMGLVSASEVKRRERVPYVFIIDETTSATVTTMPK